MKKLILLTILMLAVGVRAFAAYTTVTVKDSISSNTTWAANQQYLLKGLVYVTFGTTLTIDAGTIIRGDKATKGTLIIERGAKIICNGTVDLPVIFTSNEPQGSRSHGDWGGIIICGSAPVNWLAGEAKYPNIRSYYGGYNPTDNSGKLSFVRIEFAGVALSANNELPGLSLCGVGSGTQIDHIQVSHSGDDAFSWFGGIVNAKYLVSHRNVDDDFNTHYGYNGMNQFCVALRDPNVADISGSNAFQSESYANGTVSGVANNFQVTKPIFVNATVVGPLVTPTSTAWDNVQHKSGVNILNGGSASIINSIILGFGTGVIIQEPSTTAIGSTVANIGAGLLECRNNIIAGTPVSAVPNPYTKQEIRFYKGGSPIISYDTTVTGTNWPLLAGVLGPLTWLQTSIYENIQYTSGTAVNLWDPFNLTNPNFYPKSSSPIVYNNKPLPLYIPAGTFPGNVYPFDPVKPINKDTSNLFKNYNAPSIVPDFAFSKANNAFFDKVNYVGAFGGIGSFAYGWMAKWTNFDPNNTFYEWIDDGISAINNSIQSVNVYPNPTINNATVSIMLSAMMDLRISLHDVTGKIIKEVYNGPSNSDADKYNIDLKDVSAGIYSINISTDDARQTVKLVVIK